MGEVRLVETDPRSGCESLQSNPTSLHTLQAPPKTHLHLLHPRPHAPRNQECAIFPQEPDLVAPVPGEQNNPCPWASPRDAGPAWASRPRSAPLRSPREPRALPKALEAPRRPGAPGRPRPPHDLGSAALLRASVSPPRPRAGGLSAELAPVEPQASHTPPSSRPPFRPTYAGRRPLRGHPPSPGASAASLPPPPAARVLHRRRRRRRHGTCGRQARLPQRSRFARSYSRR